MTVTSVESLDKKRSKVSIDGDFAFVLYKGEIRHFKISEGQPLKEEYYSEIMNEILPKRARERILNLLKVGDKTVWEARKKLKESLYPDSIIEETLDILQEYTYLDDEAYVRNYIEVKQNRKSLAEMKQNLMAKGISQDTLRTVLYDVEADCTPAIMKYLTKKHYSDDMPYEEKQKVWAYLMRRGFRSGDIRKVCDDFSEFV